MDNMLKAGTRELREVSQEVRGILPKCKAASCLVKLRAGQGANRMPSKAVREGAGTLGSPKKTEEWILGNLGARL